MARQPPEYPYDPSRPIELISMGRVAVDFYCEQIGSPLDVAQSFRLYLGGCAGNIAVGASRLGLKVAMFSRVGTDDMGRFLRTELEREGVDTTLLAQDPDHLTGLVVLGIEPPDRFPLIFYRENCADMQLGPEDVDESVFRRSKSLLITGTGLSRPEIRAATHHAVALARREGVAVILDIDYRPVLWGLTEKGDGESRYQESFEVTSALQEILPEVDLVVGTREEFQVAGGEAEPAQAVARVRSLTRATLVVKHGEAGCSVIAPDGNSITSPPFAVPVLNVLGAGDAFLAGFLRGWLRGEDYAECARFGNANGALVVSRHGCAPAMASFEELEHFMAAPAEPGSPGSPGSDTTLARLHRRVVLGRTPDLCVLAFDHRSQFEESCAAAGREATLISDFKELVYTGFLRALDSRPLANAAILVDPVHGKKSLAAATLRRHAIGAPIEAAGSVPVEWLESAPLYPQILERPKNWFVKVLVRHGKELSVDDRQLQLERLRELGDICTRLERRLMVEVIPLGAGEDLAGELAESLAEFYETGIDPMWWKLPAQESAADWRTVTDVVDRYDSEARIVVLGGAATLDRFANWFSVTRSSRHGAGFAVGRSVFWDAWEDYLADRTDGEGVVKVVAQRYAELCELWLARSRETEASYA